MSTPTRADAVSPQSSETTSFRRWLGQNATALPTARVQAMMKHFECAPMMDLARGTSLLRCHPRARRVPLYRATPAGGKGPRSARLTEREPNTTVRALMASTLVRNFIFGVVSLAVACSAPSEETG